MSVRFVACFASKSGVYLQECGCPGECDLPGRDHNPWEAVMSGKYHAGEAD